MLGTPPPSLQPTDTNHSVAGYRSGTQRSTCQSLQKKSHHRKHIRSSNLGGSGCFCNPLIARYRLQEDSSEAAAFTDLFNFDPANDTLHDLLDRFDVKIFTLNNVGEVISDAMKATLLKRALASSNTALHVRVSVAPSVNVLDYSRVQK